MTRYRCAGGTGAWRIRGPTIGALGSNVMMLAAALAPAFGLAAGCGPAQFPGKEGFTDSTTVSDSGSETAVVPDLPAETETETETGEPECPELVQTGSISINSPEILTALSGVTKIDGDAELVGEFGLLEAGLEPLRCLEEITGYFYVHEVDIENFVGLEKLRRIGEYFYVGQTFNLQSMEGLSALRQVGGFLHYSENFALVSTAGTDLLVDVGDFVIVDNNPVLQDLIGLASLPGTNGQLRIDSNASLTSLTGLDNIIGVSGDFGVLSNPSLTDTSALEGLRAVGGNVLWQNNPGVSSLNFDSLQTVDGYMILAGMPSLATLDDLSGLIGINTHLYIFETGLTDIDGLIDLEFLGGDIWIENNPNLSNINGLLSLDEAFGVVRIDQNPALVDATGLDNLTVAHDGLSLWGNQNLATVGLGSLESVTDYLRIGFSGLSSLPPTPVHTIGGDLLIFNNGALVDASGFSALETIGGRLYLRENPALTGVDFGSLTQVFGRVQFIDNDALLNLNGLSSLQLAQEINIRENYALNNISGLSGLTQVPGFFKVIENEGLSIIAGINALTQIGGDFDIRDNLNLQVINGLTALNAVGGDVTITGNIDLPTCTAQGVVDGISFIGGAVDISGNLPDACSP